MTAKLYSLSYLSVATLDVDEGVASAILEDAIAFNLAHGLTGFLLCNHGRFLQYLEGSPVDLEAVMQRIRASSSHRDILVLHEGVEANRLCPAWNMGWQLRDGDLSMDEVLAMLQPAATSPTQRHMLGIARTFLEAEHPDAGLPAQWNKP